MASTFTPNLSVEKPGSGDYVGTWDSPVNSNMGIYDSALGTTQSIALGAGSITLSTAQTRSVHLNFSGVLPANVTVTIPTLSSAPGTTVSGRFFTVQNLVSNSSQFTVTMLSTVAGSQAIALPPGEAVDVMMEGSGSSTVGALKFRNLGRVGSYWDYVGSSVPAWVTGCTIPPYLNCDGTTFSSGTYPALFTILGSTTLPDSRGRYRAALNQGQARITSGASTGGVDGNTIFASGGAQTTTLSSGNVPPVPITDPSHFHFTVSSGTVSDGDPSATNYVREEVTGTGDNSYSLRGTLTTAAHGKTSTTATGITAGSATPTNFTNLPPTYISGLTLIRAA